MKIWYRPIWLWVISVATHFIAGFHYWVFRGDFPARDEWTGQFYFLLALSLILSFWILSESFLLSKRASSFIKIGFHFFLVTIIGLPFGEDMDIEFLLLIVVLLETGFYIPIPWNLPISLGFIVGAYFMNSRAVSVWGYTVSRANIFSALTISFVAFMFACLIFALRYFQEQSLSGEAGRKRLEESVAALTSANMDFQHYAVRAEEASTLLERKRISREIHDSIGYTLTNIIMMMQAAMDVSADSDEKIREILSQTRTQAQVGLNETRRALRELRSMDEQSHTGLKALFHLTHTFERATGVEVILESGNTPWSLGEEIDQVVFRLIQEGMTNAFRHGRATKISINLWCEKEGISLVILDNGLGCEVINEGIGLSGMKERIAALRGRMEIGNTLCGFKVAAFIPVELYGKDGNHFGG